VLGVSVPCCADALVSVTLRCNVSDCAPNSSWTGAACAPCAYAPACGWGEQAAACASAGSVCVACSHALPTNARYDAKVLASLFSLLMRPSLAPL
jgi:hypothetical protein